MCREPPTVKARVGPPGSSGLLEVAVLFAAVLLPFRPAAGPFAGLHELVAVAAAYFQSNTTLPAYRVPATAGGLCRGLKGERAQQQRQRETTRDDDLHGVFPLPSRSSGLLEIAER